VSLGFVGDYDVASETFTFVADGKGLFCFYDLSHPAQVIFYL
jgi:hypothetical protein